MSVTTNLLGSRIHRQIERVRAALPHSGEGSGEVVKLVIHLPEPGERLKVKLEAESKHALPSDASTAALEAAVRAAGEVGLSALVPPAERERFGRFGLAPKVFPPGKTADDRNTYYDDDRETLDWAAASLSARELAGGRLRVVAKLPPEHLGGGVLARLEIERTLAHGTVDDALAALGDDELNPTRLLGPEAPGLDLASLAPRIVVDDVRRKYDVFGPDGEPTYVLTIDHARARAVPTSREVAFSEVEIERNDGATTPAALRELVDLSTAVAAQAGLPPLVATKVQRARGLLRAR